MQWLLVLVFFVLPYFVSADTTDYSVVWSQYSTAELNGQDSWVTDNLNEWRVVSGGLCQSSKCLQGMDSGGNLTGKANKTFTDDMDQFGDVVRMQASIYYEVSQDGIEIEYGSTQSDFCTVGVLNDVFEISDGGLGAGPDVFVGSTTAGVWYEFFTEIDFLNNTCRVISDDFGTSDNLTMVATSGTKWNRVEIDPTNTGTGAEVYVGDMSLSAVFSATSTSNSYSNTIYQIVQPQHGAFLQENPQMFSFKYTVSNLALYDTVGIEIRRAVDNSLFQNLESTITTTGSDTFFRYFNLEWGTGYYWRPYLKLSTASSTYCYSLGCSGKWLAVSLVYSESVYELEFQPASSSASSSPIGDLGIDISSTTIFGQFHDILAGKFPFAYMVDFVDGWFTFRSSISSVPSSLQYSYNDGFSTGTITFISTASSSDFIHWSQQTRWWSSMIIWFLFGIWAFGLATKLL